MMGQHTRSESLFYYFRLEDQVPKGHLLRMIDTHIDFSFVREQLRDSYSDTGRPSITRIPMVRSASLSATLLSTMVRLVPVSRRKGAGLAPLIETRTITM